MARTEVRAFFCLTGLSGHESRPVKARCRAAAPGSLPGDCPTVLTGAVYRR
ncbi:hypothetical protein C7S14_0694 [Burkholderia cepacia]|nr:hypothetical protein C7S14_0694 [Burkholderia cepacia]